MSADWERVLSDCEGRLATAAATLSAKSAGTAVGVGVGIKVVELPTFAAPDVDGPIPAALETRARAIVEQGEALERRLTGERERIRLELRRLPRMPPAQNQARFDSRA